MNNFYALYPPMSSSSGGVITLNGLSGALTLAAGANITITPSGGDTLTIAATTGSPTGDNNTLAYFDASGNLADNTDARFAAATNSMFFGSSGTATIDFSGPGSLLHGTADNASIFQALGPGSQVHGVVDNGSTIQATGSGSHAHGSAIGNGSTVIEATNPGATAMGAAVGNSAVLSAMGVGCMAFGAAQASSSITASGAGSMAMGEANSGNILSSGDGSIALGLSAFGSNGTLTASGGGSIALGAALNGKIVSNSFGSIAMGQAASQGSASGGLLSTSNGSIAMGYAENRGFVSATNSGAIALGYSIAGSGGINGILSSGLGSFAAGFADANGALAASVSASENGAFAFGYAFDNQSTITSSGLGSVIFGYVPNADSSSVSSGDGSFTAGQGHVNDSQLTAIFGRWAETTPSSPSTWVDTDPLFILGNGTAGASRSNAARIDKDGKQYQMGAKRVPIRVITGSDSVSARGDQKIVMNDIAAGANTLTLPAGEEGLTFQLTLSSANTGTFTVTPTGGDTLEPNIQLILNTSMPVSITFSTGVWYAV